MLAMTAIVERVETDYVHLIDIKEFGNRILSSQRTRSGRWSKRLSASNEGATIAFNAEISSYSVRDTDGESYQTVTKKEIKPTGIARIIKSY